MTKSWIIWSLVMCTGHIEKVWTQQNFKQTVGSEATECDIKGQLLFCDYENSQQDVFMEPLVPREGIIKVFLYNIKKLHLDESVCVNVTLHNVKEMVLKGETQSECERFELTAKKSNMDKIPQNVNRLYLEECEVNSLKSSSEQSKLNIISSNIKELDLSKSLANGTMAVIQGSQIDSLQNFTVDLGSTLIVQKSTIKNIRPSALKLRNGEIVIKDSTVNPSEGSVSMAPGNSLKMGNFQGELTITTEPNNPEGIEERERMKKCPKEMCKESKLFLVLFSVCFILLICSWIGFVAYVFKDKILKLISKTPKEPAIDPENPTETKPMMGDGNSQENLPAEDEQNSEKAESVAKQAIAIKPVYGKLNETYDLDIKEIDGQFTYEQIGKVNTIDYLMKKNTIMKRKIDTGFTYLNELRNIRHTYQSLLNQSLLDEEMDSPNTKEEYGDSLRNSFMNINKKIVKIFKDLVEMPSDYEQNAFKDLPPNLIESYSSVWRNLSKTKLELLGEHITLRIRDEITELQLSVQGQFVQGINEQVNYLSNLMEAILKVKEKSGSCR